MTQSPLWCPICDSRKLRYELVRDVMPTHPHGAMVFETKTLVGFGGFEGPCNHDDNCLLRRVICEHGHKTTISKRRTCPACDWQGKARCFCHDGDKFTEWPEL